MPKCFSCKATRKPETGNCFSGVRIVPDKSKAQVWLVKLDCPGGVISLTTEIIGSKSTALDYGDRMARHFLLC